MQMVHRFPVDWLRGPTVALALLFVPVVLGPGERGRATADDGAWRRHLMPFEKWPFGIYLLKIPHLIAASRGGTQLVQVI